MEQPNPAKGTRSRNEKPATLSPGEKGLLESSLCHPYVILAFLKSEVSTGASTAS